MKLIKFLGIIMTGTAVWAAGLYIGCKIYSTNENITEKKPDIAAIKAETKEASAVKEDTITESTKIVYEYYYDEDGYIERVEDKPPYYLLELDRESLEEKMQDWQVLEFSQKEVVMRKTISAKGAQNYIIGEYEGLVAVYYEEPVNGESVMDITDTPVSSLPEEEQIRIKNGIKIKGQNELIKCMENYES